MSTCYKSNDIYIVKWPVSVHIYIYCIYTLLHRSLLWTIYKIGQVVSFCVWLCSLFIRIKGAFVVFVLFCFFLIVPVLERQWVRRVFSGIITSCTSNPHSVTSATLVTRLRLTLTALVLVWRFQENTFASALFVFSWLLLSLCHCCWWKNWSFPLYFGPRSPGSFLNRS